jgi:hypothetical protein
MDFDLPHSPPVLSLLGLHSPTSLAHPPEAILHVCKPAFSRSSSFLPAIYFFIQDLFRHMMTNHTFHVTQSAYPRLFVKYDNVSMALDGLDFVLWSQSALTIQKEGPIDFSDRCPLKDPQGLFVRSSQGPGFSSLCCHSFMGILFSVILISLEGRCNLNKFPQAVIWMRCIQDFDGETWGKATTWETQA